MYISSKKAEGVRSRVVYVSSKIAFLAVLCAFIMLTAEIALAQNGNNGTSTTIRNTVSISVSAEVQSSLEIETLSNITVDRVSPGQQEIIVNPRQDPGAGLLRVSGSQGGLFRISFVEEQDLVPAGGGRALAVIYEISGSATNNQLNSEIILQENRQLQLSDEGEYFFWVGGRITLVGDIIGEYIGEFTIEVDFI